MYGIFFQMSFMTKSKKWIKQLNTRVIFFQSISKIISDYQENSNEIRISASKIIIFAFSIFRGGEPSRMQV